MQESEEEGQGEDGTKQELVAKDENPEDTAREEKDKPETQQDEEKELNELDEKQEGFNEQEKVQKPPVPSSCLLIAELNSFAWLSHMLLVHGWTLCLVRALISASYETLCGTF